MSFIKIHREIIEHPCFINATDFKIFSWLLLKANYKDSSVGLKTGRSMQSVSLKRGQLLFGRHAAEMELNIDGSTIYKSLQRLDKWECISQQSNNQYTLITIVNYDTYQSNIDESVTSKEQVSNSKVTSKEQVSNTYKEEIEVKESKELIHPLQTFTKNLTQVSKLKTQLTYENCMELLKIFQESLVKDVLLQMENKADLTKKYTSVYLTCNNWCKNNSGNKPKILEKQLGPVAAKNNLGITK